MKAIKLTTDEKVEFMFCVLGVSKYDYMQISTAKAFISHWEKYKSFKTLLTYLGEFMGNTEQFYDLIIE